MTHDAVSEDVVPQVHYKIVIQKILGNQYGMGEPFRIALVDEMYGHIPGPGFDGVYYLLFIRTQDYAYFIGSCFNHILDGIEEDRLIGYWYQLFLLRECKRAKPGAGATGEYESLHKIHLN